MADIDTASTTVRHHPDRGVFLLLDGDGRALGRLDYRDRGDALVMNHTEIDPRLQGNGLGAILVRGALDQVRQEDRRILPTCWFVRTFVEENPDYADLVA